MVMLGVYNFIIIFKIIIVVGYSGILESYPQGGTCIPCPPALCLSGTAFLFPFIYGHCAGFSRLCLGSCVVGMV